MDNGVYDSIELENREKQPLLKAILAQVDIVIVLMGLVGLMFIFELLLGGSENSGVLIALGANFKPLLQQGEVGRLLTSVFLHGGFLHLAVNSYGLFLLGKFVNKVYGGHRFFIVFILTGIIASTVSALMNSGLSVGASGGIAGLLGLLLSFTLRNKALLNKKFTDSFLKNIVFIIVINVVIGLSAKGIDNWAHLGGFLAGILMGFIFSPVIFKGSSSTFFSRIVKISAMLVGSILVAAFIAQALYLNGVYNYDKASYKKYNLPHIGKISYPRYFFVEKTNKPDAADKYSFSNLLNIKLVLTIPSAENYSKQLNYFRSVQNKKLLNNSNGLQHYIFSGQTYVKGSSYYYKTVFMQKENPSKGNAILKIVVVNKPLTTKQIAVFDKMASSFRFGG